MYQTSTTAPDHMFGHDVYDVDGNKIGSVDNVWVDDATNALEFIGVKTGWIFGKTHVIPTSYARFEDGRITVPYPESVIQDAPSFPADHELSLAEEDLVYSHYGMKPPAAGSQSGTDDVTIQTETRTMGGGAREERVEIDRGPDTADTGATDARY
jgi:sporulation protein YlmC with PRC-barrel domain